MLEEVTIKNFKCFNDLYVPELGRMTLISGKNNTGKTSLLEALFLFLDRGRPDMLLRQYGWRGIPKVELEPISFYGPFFNNRNMAEEISMEIKIDGNQQKAIYKFREDFIPPPPSSVDIKTTLKTSTEENIAPISALNIKYINNNKEVQVSHLWMAPDGRINLTVEKMLEKACPGYFIFTNTNLNKEVIEQFSKLSQRNKESEVIEFLRIIEPDLEAIKVFTSKDIVTLHGKLINFEHTMELNLMGQGLIKLLRIILAIISTENGTVFIDEFENGLHHSALPKIWAAISKALHKYNCQLIATTHSRECLEASCEAYQDYSEDYRHIRLDRKEGKFVAKLSNYEMVASAIKNNLELR